ncbi:MULTISPECIES: hypothetical protein [unclassified Streptomyces]|uniref:hypothetical protein n=1 Tax=unclassified Streptomyces TaxID=2593676 RepID=UPI0036EC7AF1
MQPSAGPALPHTRTRTVHWITTAAALGAIVAAGALVQPADASSGGAEAPATPVAAPDPQAVTYPLDCAGAPVEVLNHVSGDLDGDGRPETVVVVRCRADTGTPPSGVFVLAAPATAGGRPTIAETLVRPADKRSVTGFRLQGRTVRATVLGYSSDTTPRCCPDLKRDYSWEWRDGRYVALPGPANNSI